MHLLSINNIVNYFMTVLKMKNNSYCLIFTLLLVGCSSTQGPVHTANKVTGDSVTQFLAKLEDPVTVPRDGTVIMSYPQEKKIIVTEKELLAYTTDVALALYLTWNDLDDYKNMAVVCRPYEDYSGGQEVYIPYAFYEDKYNPRNNYVFSYAITSNYKDTIVIVSRKTESPYVDKKIDKEISEGSGIFFSTRIKCIPKRLIDKIRQSEDGVLGFGHLNYVENGGEVYTYVRKVGNGLWEMDHVGLVDRFREAEEILKSRYVHYYEHDEAIVQDAFANTGKWKVIKDGLVKSKLEVETTMKEEPIPDGPDPRLPLFIAPAEL